jgi:hypothetical protein
MLEPALKHTGIKFLDKFFEGRKLNQIDTDVLRAYRKSRKAKDTTINRDLALLRRMMVLTIEEKKLQFTMPKFPTTSEAGNARQGFVEPAKFNELLNAMPENPRPYLLELGQLGRRYDLYSRQHHQKWRAPARPDQSTALWHVEKAVPQRTSF